ncbi:site-specific integrase [Halorubrum ezzemoulense]|uniref:tyrosine-type recombinase/integrase n=1 Tax=Halorubrum ezzemoulense TaxID=337243 RepID=UPI00232B7898|nr:site-specific integrase [Halorubrum ezzemoulense]MDB9247401.1 site-specific integrase [Halorubrum ezzemoulense]MDB9258690.1 site-specific integrase [Halorubrum ezzemoulense]MDB9264452.1 site-specific integrase [Halorubrum ezzemoulense]MDB9269051.1 site-specific integrase [Halorubrum ezzemoulense]MDB9271420.1 site-specific integrase [Halorubrum ezzemoulense]
MTDDADTTTAEQALEMYLDTRRDEVSETTLSAHGYRLRHFVRWCDENSYVMDDLDETKLHEFRLWRRDDGDLNTVSLHTQLSTLRVFLRFCGNIGLVESDLYDRLVIPTMDPDDDRRKQVLEPDRAENILQWLNNYEYASFDHVVMLLLWELGCRIGGLHSLDLADYDSEGARIHFRHRPDTGTALKNGSKGERIATLKRSTTVVIDDYIERNRRDVSDAHGRQPLLTTRDGRPSLSTIRRHVYRCTQPCQRTGECPHDVDMDDCDARGYKEVPSACPSILRPHDIRRGSITHWLREDVPKKAVSDRMDVEEKSLDKHYDQRSEETRAEQRREYLDDV